MAIVVFTGYGSEFISRYYAKIGMILFGAIAILINLISFRFDSSSENNPFFWVGSVGIFVGLILKMYQIHYNSILIIVGILISGFSYFFNPIGNKNYKDKDDELLDQ